MCALQNDVNRQINDISECSICTEIYSDPRVLPCIHTFCLRCLEDYGKGKKPGSGIPCPLCRKSVTVPKAGLKDLPKNTLAQRLVETIGSDVKDDMESLNHAITKKTAALLRQKEQLDLKWAHFSENSISMEQNIEQHKDYLKRLIDDDAMALNYQIKSFRHQALSVLQTERTELDAGLARLNDLLIRSNTGNSGKTKTDEWRAIQAEVNMALDGIQQPRDVANISFRPLNVLGDRKQNVIGRIEVCAEFASMKQIEVEPRLIKTLMSNVNADGVMGLCVIDDLVYVMHNWATKVDVHDLAFSTIQCQISVPGLDLPNDMAACRRRNYLYITDFSPYVHRVEVGIRGVCSKWLAGDGPLAISVTGSTTNVIVTFHAAQKIKEFSASGSLLREVSLSPEITNPHHAVVLDSGELLVCHGFETDPCNRLCVVDDVTGGVIKSMECELRQPARIAIDAVRGVAYVADLKNDRVVLVDLSSLQKLSFLTGVGRRPYAIFVDKGNGTLYVGSWEDGQIATFDISDVHCVD